MSLPEPEYLSTAAAAAITGLSIAWFERIRWAGGGPPYMKVGRSVRYSTQELRAFMAARRRTSTSDQPALT